MMKISFFLRDGENDADAIGAGVYLFMVGLEDDKEENYLPLYVGESYSMMVRCSNHIYEVFYNDPAYFGLSYEHIKCDRLRLIAKVYKSVRIKPGTSRSERDRLLKEHELNVIKEVHPLSQLQTSDNLCENRVQIVGEAIDKLLSSCNF